MKNKGKVLRSKKLKIESASGRTMEQKGFDDMAAINLGDESNVYKAQAADDSSYGSDISRSFYDTVQKEDKEKRKKLLIFGIVMVFCIAIIISIGMVVKHYNEQIDGKIRVNYSTSDFEGSNYEEVISQLEKQGFTNIRTNPEEDLITGWITKNGEVEEVEIDGNSNFSSSSRFLPDVEIIITYHTFSND